VLRCGVPNVIRVAKEILEPHQRTPKGIRIDSGDMPFLVRESRSMLDAAGYYKCGIIPSGGINPKFIINLLAQGARVAGFGVGENISTSKADPILGAIYKLVGIFLNNLFNPTMKLAQNIAKESNPGQKQVYRLYNRKTGIAIADVVTLAQEKINENYPIRVCHPVDPKQDLEVSNFYAKPLLVKIFDKGRLVYDRPSAHQIRAFAKQQQETLPEDVRRLENPESYFVGYSSTLRNMKNNLRAELQRTAC